MIGPRNWTSIRPDRFEDASFREKTFVVRDCSMAADEFSSVIYDANGRHIGLKTSRGLVKRVSGGKI
jgi:hypothetical protein